jgi:hypothetical protein
MASLAHTGFTHRPNPDGTTATFCNKCFKTVASAQWEAELERAERTHVCDPLILEHWESLSDPHRFNKHDQG